MTAAVLGFAESAPGAGALAEELGVPLLPAEVRSFPDGESLVRVPGAADTVLLYRSLDHPNAKLVEILLAASALRGAGAARVMLIAPYLGYMRQDAAFRPGEAISQRVIGGLIADRFDGLVTIDPHLHRIRSLAEAVPRIPALALSAAPVLARAIAADERPLLVGPDSESRPWVEAIARPLGLEFLLGEKRRKGDRDVDLEIGGIAAAAGRAAILVDDVISSGTTLIAAAALLRAAGAVRVEALATHCLAEPGALARLGEAGIARVRACATVPGPAASLPVAGVLARAIRDEGWLKPGKAAPGNPA